MKKLTREEYYNRINEVYKDIFEVDINSIKTTRDKVNIYCKLCNTHSTIVLNTLLINKNKKHCPNCSPINKGNRENKEDKINKLKSKFPNLDFNNFVYKNNNTKSIVICNIHGEFRASYSDLIRKLKYGCPECSKIAISKYNKLTQEEVISRLELLYPNLDFSKFVYKGCQTKSIVICPKHGEFENTYDHMMDITRQVSIDRGTVHGCPKCANSNISSKEKEIVEYIKSIYNGLIIENDRSIILNEYTNKYLELDIYVPEKKLAIEFNGRYYHSDKFINKRTNNVFSTAKKYHDYKTLKCKEKGITLIHIEEDEYINNKEKILDYLKLYLE